MTVDELAPAVVSGVMRRAADPLQDRWWQQVESCGFCARPVRLQGQAVRQFIDGTTETFTTRDEPDGVLLVRCGNRRASVCPSCSFEYKGDMWHLLHAGAVGGSKGVPETIVEHPMVFATLTAPGFGLVHTTRVDRSGKSTFCRARRDRPTCPHGRRTWCVAIHDPRDPTLGEPFCGDCYDYDAAVAFNWFAPELWRRFTITLRRSLSNRLGWRQSEFRERLRLSYAKVAELQRRGVVHFHAIIRLDGPGDGFDPPPIDATTDLLIVAIVEAATHVRLVVNSELVLCFGEQVDVRTMHGSTGDEEISPQVVAAYVAKYATKAAEDFGAGNRRLSPHDIRYLDLRPHVARIVLTAWELGDREEFDGIRRWTHMLGFRGHFSTKSRRFSTTLGSLRSARRHWRCRRLAEARGVGADEETTLVINEWRFVGIGYTTAGDAALAMAAAAHARERRSDATGLRSETPRKEE